MNCGNDLIKIYFMVLLIMISVGQCKFEIATNLQDQKQVDPSLSQIRPTNYNKFLKILYLKRRSEELDKKIKQKLDDIILQNKIELMKDQTKAQLLKIGNSCLENYSQNDGRNSETTKSSRSTNKAGRLKYTSDPKKYINGLSTIKLDAKKFLRNRKYSQNSAPNLEKRKSKMLSRHKLWKREDDDNDKMSNDDHNHKLLEQIVDELGDIKESINATTHHKESANFLNGTWESDLVGLSFTITFHEDVCILTTKTTCKPECATTPKSKCKTTTTTTTTRNPLKVDKKDANLKIAEISTDGSVKMARIVDTSFTITARVPFGRNTMLIITALHPKSKTVVVFLGQYKYCDKQELIIGRWTLEKYAHHCQEVEINEDTYGDILRRPKKS